MGFFDGLLGGLVGAGVATLAKNVLEQQGGVQGLVSQFEKTGLGSIVQSWVGKGANQPITAEQIQQALGSETVKALAEKAGLPADKIAEQLAQILPSAVDKLTPNGTIEPPSKAA